MPKFEFTCTHDTNNHFGERKNTVIFEVNTLDEVIAEMQDFLRGCGYYFEGELDIYHQSNASEWTYTINSDNPFVAQLDGHGLSGSIFNEQFHKCCGNCTKTSK